MPTGSSKELRAFIGLKIRVSVVQFRPWAPYFSMTYRFDVLDCPISRPSRREDRGPQLQANPKISPDVRLPAVRCQPRKIPVGPSGAQHRTSTSDNAAPNSAERRRSPQAINVLVHELSPRRQTANAATASTATGRWALSSPKLRATHSRIRRRRERRNASGDRPPLTPLGRFDPDQFVIAPLLASETSRAYFARSPLA